MKSGEFGEKLPRTREFVVRRRDLERLGREPTAAELYPLPLIERAVFGGCEGAPSERPFGRRAEDLPPGRGLR